jgi:hypothetical protein
MILQGSCLIAVQFGFYLTSGWAWWIWTIVSYGTSIAAPPLYRLVRNSSIYFFGTTAEAVNLDGSELDDLLAIKERDKTQHLPHIDQKLPDRDTFQHTSLRGSKGFRCLLLKSARKKDAVIECELYYLSVDTPAIYEVVSYCWEDIPCPCRYIYAGAYGLFRTQKLSLCVGDAYCQPRLGTTS